MLDPLINFIQNLATQVPLTVYTFIGSVLDEVIAIIPSPLIPITAGTLAVEQHQTVSFLFLIALTGALGKTMASYGTYYISDKLEDVVTSKLGKYFGLEKGELEKYGRYFNGSSRDDIVLCILRILPFIPTLPITVLAGVIKIKPKTFIVSTFIGMYIRFVFYLYIAYIGVKKYEGVLNIFEKTNTVFELMIVLSVLGWIFLYLRKNWDTLLEKFFKAKKITSKKDQTKEKTKKLTE